VRLSVGHGEEHRDEHRDGRAGEGKARRRPHRELPVRQDEHEQRGDERERHAQEDVDDVDHDAVPQDVPDRDVRGVQGDDEAARTNDGTLSEAMREVDGDGRRGEQGQRGRREPDGNEDHRDARDEQQVDGGCGRGGPGAPGRDGTGRERDANAGRRQHHDAVLTQSADAVTLRDEHAPGREGDAAARDAGVDRDVRGDEEGISVRSRPPGPGVARRLTSRGSSTGSPASVLPP